jgi:hypothetical protein
MNSHISTSTRSSGIDIRRYMTDFDQAACAARHNHTSQPNQAPSWAEIDAKLKSRNLRSVDVGGAGDCQYHVLAHSLKPFGITQSHSDIRQMVADELEQNPALYRGFVTVDDSTGDAAAPEFATYKTFVENTRKPGTWGDHVTFQAAANVFDVPFLIFHPGPGPPIELCPGVSRAATTRKHAIVAYLPEVHYRSTEAIDEATDVLLPEERALFDGHHGFETAPKSRPVRSTRRQAPVAAGVSVGLLGVPEAPARKEGRNDFGMGGGCSVFVSMKDVPNNQPLPTKVKNEPSSAKTIRHLV